MVVAQKGLKPDIHFNFPQNGKTKWENVGLMLRSASWVVVVRKRNANKSRPLG